MAVFFATNSISMVQGGNSEWGMDTHSLLRICVAEKLLSPTILSVSIYKLGVVITASEKAMAPHSSTLAWEIPWMEEPSSLQSVGSLRVGHA